MRGLKFDEDTGELVLKNGVQPKIVNIAYQLTEDLKVPGGNFMEDVDKLIESRKKKGAKKGSWKKQVEALLETVAKKGDLFFKSKLYQNKKGEYYLYNNNVTTEVLAPKDPFFGKNGPFVERNKYKLWERYLSWPYVDFSRGKFKEIKTDELSFEQVHIVEILEDEKKRTRENIDARREHIKAVNRIINRIKYD